MPKQPDQVDDVLLNYAGIPLNKNQDMLDVIKKLSGNGSATIPVQVWRDGRQLEVPVRPGRLGIYFPNDPAPVAIAARRWPRTCFAALCGAIASTPCPAPAAKWRPSRGCLPPTGAS